MNKGLYAGLMFILAGMWPMAGRTQAADHDKVFKAGSAMRVITPPIGTSINGGMQDRMVRKPDAKEVARAEGIVAHAEGPNMKTREDIYVRESLLLQDYPDQMDVLLQAFRIGHLGIAAIPCEVFVETGLELKEKSPVQPMFTISLANGYFSYLPTPEQHALGGYETWKARSSFLEVDASDKITGVVLELLNKLN